MIEPHLNPAHPVTGDGAAAVLALLADGDQEGVRGALVTLTDNDGGPRPVGALMAVLADGRWRGHLSGGCVERAVAVEALAALAEGRDRTLRLGAGSPMIDVRLPCGGGLTLWIGVDPPAGWAMAIGCAIGERRTVTARLRPGWALVDGEGVADVGGVARVFRPPLRLLILGSGPEALATASLARASGLELHLLATRDELAAQARAIGLSVELALSPACPAERVDSATAILCLTHEAEWDVPFLAAGLPTPAVFVGALGSPRTHALRLAALADLGVTPEDAARIRSPVGLVTGTRDSRSLAVSVLAELTAVAAEHGLTGA